MLAECEAGITARIKLCKKTTTHICIASQPDWVSSCLKRLYKASCFPSADRPDDHSECQDAVKNYRADV